MLKEIKLHTQAKETAVDVTGEVQAAVAAGALSEGFVFIYVPHAAAAVSIHRSLSREHAPKLDQMLAAVNPDREAPEFTKAAFVAPTEVGLVKDGRLLLGEDQRIYFYEFDGPRKRSVYVYVGG
ncbi:MAG: YjbQ family protein [Candidatus Bipolaricaulaceae bacterium]